MVHLDTRGCFLEMGGIGGIEFWMCRWRSELAPSHHASKRDVDPELARFTRGFEPHAHSFPMAVPSILSSNNYQIYGYRDII
jgi:hypothetical protein